MSDFQPYSSLKSLADAKASLRPPIRFAGHERLLVHASTKPETHPILMAK